jgi:hypothetical protein
MRRTVHRFSANVHQIPFTLELIAAVAVERVEVVRSGPVQRFRESLSVDDGRDIGSEFDGAAT